MAELVSNYMTLGEIIKRQTQDKSLQQLIEMLAQQTPVARGGYTEICNQGKSHLTTLRAALPSNPTWVQYYSRINPVASGARQVVDTTGRTESMTSIDERLYNDTKDKATLLMQESLGVIETFAQEIEQTFFYGDTASAPLEFLGLAPRMNSTSSENGRMILKGGGTGSANTSIFGVTWGPRTGHLLVPENTTAGVKREFLGRQRDQNSDGVRWMIEEKFEQQIGFTMPDWRYHFRICNIDVNKLTSASAADLVDLIITAYYRLPARKSTTGFSTEGAPVKSFPVLYMPPIIKEALHKQLLRQPNGTVSKGEYFGEEVMTCMGMPVLETDGISTAESAVS